MPAAGAAALGDSSWKDALAAQLAEAVLEQVECRAAAAEETLWLRGQREICSIREEYAAQNHQMRHRVAACADACRGLERENAMLRRGIEAIVTHLGRVLGRPPHASGGGGAPRAPALAPWSAGLAPGRAVAGCGRAPVPGLAGARRPAPPESLLAPLAPPIHEEQGEDAASDGESAPLSDERSRPAPPKKCLLAPPAPPIREERGVDAASGRSRPAPPEGLLAPLSPPIRDEERGEGAASDGESSPLSERSRGGAVTPDSGSASEGTETFFFMIRRAPDVPLGLEVCGGGPCGLTVRAVRPGGAIEAWNRQMKAGDRREVRVGDHIVRVNSAQDAGDMRCECVKASMLRIAVVRPAAEPTASYI